MEEVRHVQFPVYASRRKGILTMCEQCVVTDPFDLFDCVFRTRGDHAHACDDLVANRFSPAAHLQPKIFAERFHEREPAAVVILFPARLLRLLYDLFAVLEEDSKTGVNGRPDVRMRLKEVGQLSQVRDERSTPLLFLIWYVHDQFPVYASSSCAGTIGVASFTGGGEFARILPVRIFGSFTAATMRATSDSGVGRT